MSRLALAPCLVSHWRALVLFPVVTLSRQTGTLVLSCLRTRIVHVPVCAPTCSWIFQELPQDSGEHHHHQVESIGDNQRGAAAAKALVFSCLSAISDSESAKDEGPRLLGRLFPHTPQACLIGSKIFFFQFDERMTNKMGSRQHLFGRAARPASHLIPLFVCRETSTSIISLALNIRRGEGAAATTTTTQAPKGIEVTRAPTISHLHTGSQF